MIVPITSWRRNVYIAKRTSVAKVNGNQMPVYATPIAYNMNVQPLNEQTRIELFGANAKKMYKAVVVNRNLDIHELDVVYLDDATPTDENSNGDNANYVVRQVNKQNLVTAYFFESIKG
jgi:hypothetical protein